MIPTKKHHLFLLPGQTATALAVGDAEMRSRHCSFSVQPTDAKFRLHPWVVRKNLCGSQFCHLSEQNCSTSFHLERGLRYGFRGIGSR